MSVDIFGSMGDDPSVVNNTTIIQPINKYAINLDDLENVDGFNQKGNKDGVYAFKLSSEGIYTRHKITEGGGMNNGGIENMIIGFVFEEGGKITPLPINYPWDIDIRLKADKVSTKGNDHTVLKIFNSGRIIGSLKPAGHVLLTRYEGEYFLTTDKAKSSLSFEAEFNEDQTNFKDPLKGTTMIIEGRFISGGNTYREIINGLEIRSSSPNTNFFITITRGETEDKVVVAPSTISTKRSEGKQINFEKIMVSNDCYIKRIRHTSFPVSNEVIIYL